MNYDSLTIFMNILMALGSTIIEFYNYFLSIYLSHYDSLVYYIFYNIYLL